MAFTKAELARMESGHYDDKGETFKALPAVSAQHTPGPWQVHSDHLPLDIIGNIDGPDNGHMIYTTVAQVIEDERSTANARLIAAAPELLAALIGIVERGTDSPEHMAAESAIAKATGTTTAEPARAMADTRIGGV